MKYYIVQCLYDDGGGTVDTSIASVSTSKRQAEFMFRLRVSHQKQYLDEYHLTVLEETENYFFAGDGKYNSAFSEIKIVEVENDSKLEDFRDWAIDIIAMFEDILDEHNIKVPDEFREGGEEEAALYGDTYFALEDKITAYIEQRLSDDKAGDVDA